MRGKTVVKPVKMVNADNRVMLHINIILNVNWLHYRIIKAVLVVLIHVQARGGWTIFLLFTGAVCSGDAPGRALRLQRASLPLSQHAAAFSSFTSTSSIVKKSVRPCEQWRSPAPLTDGAERLRCGGSPLGFEPRSLCLVKTFRTAVGLSHRHVTNWIESLFGGGYASAFPRTLDYTAKVGFCTSVITPLTI